MGNSCQIDHDSSSKITPRRRTRGSRSCDDDWRLEVSRAVEELWEIRIRTRSVEIQMTDIVAALYVERGGPYFGMPGVDPWDKEQDARLYDGPHPVVAHPPCGPWGELRHLYQGDEHDCAPAALAAVRRWGGVLEHPARSKFWQFAQLPWPGDLPDQFGGFTVEVDQCSWGHVARKRTRLYFCGVDRSLVLSTVRTGGTPTHWVSGSRNVRTKPGSGGVTPPGIKFCSAQQRRRTPPAFAAWLVDLARAAQLTKSACCTTLLDNL